MSRSNDNNAMSSEDESSSDREARDIEEEFRATCSRALASLCHKHRYDMLLDKGHSKRSASSINGRLLNRLSGQSWTSVRDHIMNLPNYRSSKGDDAGRVAEAIIRQTKYMLVNEAFEFMIHVLHL